jgi:hypothetical protein
VCDGECQPGSFLRSRGVDFDTAALISTIIGGLVATVAAFGGSVWLEFWREQRNWERENREREHLHLERRRLQTEAAKVVALEIASQAEPLRRLVKSGTFHRGEEWGDRSAWTRTAPS